MSEKRFKELLEAGVHFGHLKRKWNPSMAPYVFAEKNGIHIIDLNKTIAKLDEAAAAMKQIAKSGKKILFIGTKKQAKSVIEEHAKRLNMPYVTERWPGGMLTNFATIRKAVRKMKQLEKMTEDTEGKYSNISKKERLLLSRQKDKLERDFGSMAELTRLPAALFIVDIHKEDIAVAEAKKLNIPTFAVVDTNSNPNEVDFAIPANDDAANSIEIIVKQVADEVAEGLAERKSGKEKMVEEKAQKVEEAKNEKKKDKAKA